MNNQTKLLSILSDGAFHSGEQLGQALGISRTGAWKIIKALEALGIDIHCVHGKGYRLPEPIELLNEEKIFSAMDLQARKNISAMEIFLSCESTNSYLMSLLKSQRQQNDSETNHSRVCVAEIQTQGRGRRGRNWVSPFGGNIYLSMLWDFHTDPHALGGLGMALSVAIIRTLKKLGVDDVSLKWPNDVLWRKRKLAGTLVEMVAESTGPCRVVIGMGINLNLHTVPASQIDQPWVDIKSILGHVPSRNRIIGLLIQELIRVINDYEQQGLEAVIEEWRQHDAYAGTDVDLHINKNRIRGRCEGIDNMGALILRNGNGHIQKFTSGEISLRAVPQ